MTASYCDTIRTLSARFIETPRGKIYCETEGEGPLLLLQSGGPGCTHQCFHPFFSDAAAFATVIYHDPIGLGKSSRIESGSYDLAGLVEEIEELRLALGGRRIVLLGHSFGGLVAQLYALRHPGALSGLVLVASAAGLPSTRRPPARGNARMTEADISAIHEALRSGSEGIAARQQRAFAAGGWKRYFVAKPNDEYMAHRRYEWDPDPRFIARIEKDARRADLAGRFADRGIPTLIVDAPQDLVWGEGKIEALAGNHPGAELELFLNSGHYPFVEERALFFRTLASFMARISP